MADRSRSEVNCGSKPNGGSASDPGSVAPSTRPGSMHFAEEEVCAGFWSCCSVPSVPWPRQDGCRCHRRKPRGRRRPGRLPRTQESVWRYLETRQHRKARTSRRTSAVAGTTVIRKSEPGRLPHVRSRRLHGRDDHAERPPRYAGAEPTPEEALAALTSYTSYFGTFSVNDAQGVVTHHVQGSLNPSMEPEQKRFFRALRESADVEAASRTDRVQSRLIWERVPNLPELTDEHRRFIGFWKQVSSERRLPNGELVEPDSVRPTQADEGYSHLHGLRAHGRSSHGSWPKEVTQVRNRRLRRRRWH